jgi:hypothetical protein
MTSPPSHHLIKSSPTLLDSLVVTARLSCPSLLTLINLFPLLVSNSTPFPFSRDDICDSKTLFLLYDISTSSSSSPFYK